MPWFRRELTQFDYDYNAVMTSLRMLPVRWVSNPWPAVLDNAEEDIHIWMGSDTCSFYFTRQKRQYGLHYGLAGSIISAMTPWAIRMRRQARRTMSSPHCTKDGPAWFLWCSMRDCTREMEAQRGALI